MAVNFAIITGKIPIQGLSGLAGVPGPEGSSGVPGQKGPQGDQGEQGPQGVKGDTGTEGPVGLLGPQGPPGKHGAGGTPGKDGSDGASGTPGQNGSPGEKGDKGDAGKQGPGGLAGSPGQDGANGDKGDTGDAGRDGAQGVQGPAGERGETGSQGSEGPQGQDGPKGDVGPQGPAGPLGPQGPAGEWSVSSDSDDNEFVRIPMADDDQKDISPSGSFSLLSQVADNPEFLSDDDSEHNAVVVSPVEDVFTNERYLYDIIEEEVTVEDESVPPVNIKSAADPTKLENKDEDIISVDVVCSIEDELGRPVSKCEVRRRANPLKDWDIGECIRFRDPDFVTVNWNEHMALQQSLVAAESEIHEVHETTSDNAARSTVQRTIESEEHCLLGYLTGEPRENIVINIDVKSCDIFSDAVTSSSVTDLQQSCSELTLCPSSVTLVNEPVNDLLPCSTSNSIIASCSSMDATSFCDDYKFIKTRNIKFWGAVLAFVGDQRRGTSMATLLFDSMYERVEKHLLHGESAMVLHRAPPNNVESALAPVASSCYDDCLSDENVDAHDSDDDTDPPEQPQIVDRELCKFWGTLLGHPVGVYHGNSWRGTTPQGSQQLSNKIKILVGAGVVGVGGLLCWTILKQ
ncbi:hypothetical protein QZH41_004389 [Actinostola sp. cb2023]|nr:hypothetical protein QZH41_004389 [Actinostola sp. cb2023]